MSKTNKNGVPTSPASEVSHSSSDIAPSASSTRPSGPASETTLNNPDQSYHDEQDLKQPDPPTKPGLQVVKVDKPHSKTAIGQVVQKLKILENPSTFELTFTTDTPGKDSKFVESCKLRHKAAEVWTNDAFSRYFHEHISINVGPRIGTARLILHMTDSKRSLAGSQVKILETSREPKILKIQGNQAKTVKATVKKLPDTDIAVREKSINFLLRETSKKLGGLEPLPSSMNCNRFFNPLVPGSSRSIPPMQPSDYQLYLRHQASIIVDKEQLNVDFDLVPCIPGKCLDRVVLDMSGLLSLKVQDSEIMQACLPQIRRCLLGTHARCAYIPGAKTDSGREKATLLTQKNINTGRAFQIRGIIMPIEDVGFDFPDKRPTMTYDYFAKILPDDKKLNAALPLVEDDTGAFIPIELVFADGPQPLHRFGHLNEVIRGAVAHYMELESAIKMFDISKSLVEHFPTAFNGENEKSLATIEARGRARFTQFADSSLTKQVVLDHPREAGKRFAAPLNILDARISMLFVEDIPEQADDHGLVNKASHGLQSLSSEVKYPYEIRTAKQIEEQTDLEGVGTDSDLLFAIIENRRHIKAGTGKTITNLHRYVDRHLGIPLVCTTTQHLASVMKGPLDPFSKRFPASLRAKINTKLGGTNFETSLQSGVKGTGLMIAGGHIAHRRPGRNRRSLPSPIATKVPPSIPLPVVKCPPSISSIVATRDDSCSQYLGSIRIHNPTVQVSDLAGRYPFHLQPHLMGMREMMKERFDKCVTPPQKILFFRDSMRFNETMQRFESECKMIKQAYKDAFEHLQNQPQITYVVVNKSTEIKTIPTSSIQPTAVPLFNYVVGDDATAKYRYYVIKNEIDYSTDELKTLTRDINESSQISSQIDRVAKPLPLQLAKKLSDRTWDYFKHLSMPFFPHRKNADASTHDEEVLHEERVTEEVIKYLGIDPGHRTLPWKESLDDYMFYL